MAQATGIFKKVAWKRETTFGTLAGASGAQYARRVTSTLDLAKDTYTSNEIRTDFQIADYRHGVRRVKGTLAGELSAKTHSDMLSSAMKRDFAAVSAITAASITIATGSIIGGVQQYTVTRGAGSFLTDGVKIGDVLRLSVGTFAAANLSKNLWVLGLTATVATVITLNGSALTAEGPIAGSTVTVQGKKTYIPTTGHTDNSYSVEHWFSDIAQSEVFTGCKVDKCSVNLPPTGMATISFDMMGKDLGSTGTAQYFSAPTVITSTGVVAAVNGLLIVNGTPQAVVTGLQFNIDPALSGDPVVGANTVPNQFPGPVNVSGQFTAYFTDNTIRDLFVNETETSLMVALTADNTAAADFVTFVFSRIKVGGASKNDGTGGVVQTFPFQSLINNNGGSGTAYEQSSVVAQDSAA